MAPRTLLASVACAVVLCGAATACTSKGESPPTVLPSVTATASTTSSPPTSTTTSPAPTSTSSAPTVEQTIIAQWQKYFTLFHSLQGKNVIEITDTLRPVATGAEAVQTAKTLSEFAQKGQKEVGDYQFGATSVVFDDATQAFVTECRDETNLKIVDIATGSTLSMGVHWKYIGTMVRGSDGVWKLGAYDATEKQC